MPVAVAPEDTTLVAVAVEDMPLVAAEDKIPVAVADEGVPLIDEDSADATPVAITPEDTVLLGVFEFVDTVLIIELTTVVIGFVDIIDVIAFVNIVVCKLIAETTDDPLILVVAVVTVAAVTVVGETNIAKNIHQWSRSLTNSCQNGVDREKIICVDVL